MALRLTLMIMWKPSCLKRLSSEIQSLPVPSRSASSTLFALASLKYWLLSIRHIPRTRLSIQYTWSPMESWEWMQVQHPTLKGKWIKEMQQALSTDSQYFICGFLLLFVKTLTFKSHENITMNAAILCPVCISEVTYKEDVWQSTTKTSWANPFVVLIGKEWTHMPEPSGAQTDTPKVLQLHKI